MSMAWERKKPLSPFWNTCVIEARMCAYCRKRPMPTRRGEPAYWTWFKFRSVYRNQNTKYGPDPLPGVPIWGQEILMKVYAFGKTGEIMRTFAKGDWIRVEGFLSGNKFKDGSPVMCILAKRVTLLARRWQSKQHQGERRNRHLMGVKALRDDERRRLIEKGLIKPSLGDLAAIPDDPPEIDQDSLDFDV